jgi:hypothetical protein
MDHLTYAFEDGPVTSCAGTQLPTWPKRPIADARWHWQSPYYRGYLPFMRHWQAACQ